MSRLFTFGCSFTEYIWPTWADILGQQFEYFENWGRRGGGNHFIFNSLIESNLKNTFNKDDTICIMWTNVTREDRYVNNEWVTPGNIFTEQSVYDENFVNKFVDIRGYYIRDLAFIAAAQQILDNIGCTYYFMSMVPILNTDQYSVNDGTPIISDIIPFYRPTLEKILPSVYEIIFNFDWYSRPFKEKSFFKKFKLKYEKIAGKDWPSVENFLDENFDGISDEIVKELKDENRWDWKTLINGRKDMHPTPLEHLEYINKALPELSNAVSINTRQWVTEIDYLLRSHKDYGHLFTKIPQKRW